MSIDEIINHLDVLASVGELAEETGKVRDINGDNSAALRMAIALLKTHPEAKPNEPLTQNQLQFMGGDPVWIVRENGVDRWALIRYANLGGINTYGCGFLMWADLGKVWFPYRRPPKEADNVDHK